LSLSEKFGGKKGFVFYEKLIAEKLKTIVKKTE